MSSSVRIRKKPTKICLGDMDTLINIYKRDLNVPKDVKYGLNLSLQRKDVWCKWDVVGKGIEIFDNVSQQVSVATDIITIHNDPDFRTFDFLEFENREPWVEEQAKAFYSHFEKFCGKKVPAFMQEYKYRKTQYQL